MRKETISAGQRKAVAQDRAAYSVSWAKTRAWHRWLAFFSLETDVEFEVFDMAV